MLSALRSSGTRLHRIAQRRGFSDNYGYGYGFTYGPAPAPPPKEEGAEAKPEGENQEEGSNSVPNEYQDFLDLPKGPTHKEMIAARRHYLKRQARRGLLPPSRPIRKPSF